ncbi:MAG: DMT family transporter [Clostridia bacterium]|nr:DMT family transporter [Clostridia bacterium]
MAARGEGSSTARNRTGARFLDGPLPLERDAEGFRRGRACMALYVLSNSAANMIERVAVAAAPPAAVTSIEVWTTAAVSILFRWVQARLQARADGAGSAVKAEGRPAARTIELWHFAAAGLLGPVTGTHSFLTAMRLGGVGFTVAIVQTWSLWAILMGILLLKEKGSWRLAIGVPASLVGILLISTQQQSLSDVSAFLSSGLPWAVLASLCFAGSSVLIRRGLSRGADQGIGFVVQYLTASILLAARAAADPAPLASLGLARIGMIMCAGVLAGVVAMGFMYRALAMCPISKVMLISASYPAIVNVLSWAFLGESVTVTGIVGILLVTSSCVWTQVEND